MKERLLGFLDRYGRMITGLGILLCVAGLAVSYVKPKQKLQTVAVNMSGEGETSVTMTQGTVVQYICSTKGYPMAGIQVGITKYGREFPDGYLLCAVYDENRESLLSQTLVAVNELDEGQYVYIPFENYESCNGTLTVEFTYSGSGEDAPGLLVNRAELADAQTVVDGREQGVSLKSYYVYKLDYYPLVFDLLTVLFLFAGVFLLSGRGKAGRDQCPGNRAKAGENQSPGNWPEAERDRCPAAGAGAGGKRAFLGRFHIDKKEPSFIEGEGDADE